MRVLILILLMTVVATEAVAQQRNTPDLYSITRSRFSRHRNTVAGRI